MRSNQTRRASARRAEPVRKSLAMPASISAAVIADRYSASVRSSNQAAASEGMVCLPGAKALSISVSSNQPVQIGLPEGRPIAVSLDRVRDVPQQSYKARAVGRIEPLGMLHRHHDGRRPPMLGDRRSLAALGRLDDGGERPWHHANRVFARSPPEWPRVVTCSVTVRSPQVPGCQSFLRHAGLAQTRRNKWLRTRRGPSAPPNISAALKSGDARITIVAAQPSGFGEFGGGAFGLAFEGIGGGEAGVMGLLVPDWRCAPFSSQMIASSVRDCSRCDCPIRPYQLPMWGSRGLRRMACSWSGIASSIDPVRILHQPR